MHPPFARPAPTHRSSIGFTVRKSAWCADTTPSAPVCLTAASRRLSRLESLSNASTRPRPPIRAARWVVLLPGAAHSAHSTAQRLQLLMPKRTTHGISSYKLHEMHASHPQCPPTPRQACTQLPSPLPTCASVYDVIPATWGQCMGRHARCAALEHQLTPNDQRMVVQVGARGEEEDVWQDGVLCDRGPGTLCVLQRGRCEPGQRGRDAHFQEVDARGAGPGTRCLCLAAWGEEIGHAACSGSAEHAIQLSTQGILQTSNWTMHMCRTDVCFSY
jgi:hypothetical protein